MLGIRRKVVGRRHQEGKVRGAEEALV